MENGNDHLWEQSFLKLKVNVNLCKKEVAHLRNHHAPGST